MNIQNSTITNQTPWTHCNLGAVLPTATCCTAHTHTRMHKHQCTAVFMLRWNIWMLEHTTHSGTLFTHIHTKLQLHGDYDTQAVMYSKPLPNLPQCHWLLISSLALHTHTYRLILVFLPWCLSRFFPHWLLVFYWADDVFHLVLNLTFIEIFIFLFLYKNVCF